MCASGMVRLPSGVTDMASFKVKVDFSKNAETLVQCTHCGKTERIDLEERSPTLAVLDDAMWYLGHDGDGCKNVGGELV